MEKKFRLSVALDIDDVLMDCVPHAINLANETYGFDPPLSIYEVEGWGPQGKRSDAILEFFEKPEFFVTQPVAKGAKEFVRKLTQMAEVFVSTSIKPEFMGIRAEQIMREFPEIDPGHIYMGSRKDKIDVDILFDDGMHNVFRSNAAYPILLRRPWNRAATGVLAVNNYDEFLRLVEVIGDSYSVRQERYSKDKPGVVVLVGPSGSGKNEVARELLDRLDIFDKLVCYTTNPAADMQSGWYHHVSRDAFESMCDSGEIFESTVYAGHYYGSRKSDVEDILARGRHVLTVMDICGAMSLKTNFRNVLTLYIKREPKELLTAILEKDIPNEDKVNRLVAVESEKQNAEICDYVVKYTTCTEAADRICGGLGL